MENGGRRLHIVAKVGVEFAHEFGGRRECFDAGIGRGGIEEKRLQRRGAIDDGPKVTGDQPGGFGARRIGTANVKCEIGAGNIGSRVGRLGGAWGMTVVGCVKHPSPERSKQLEKIGIRLEKFDEVISSSDFISIHVPLDDSTRNLINGETFSHMKCGAFLVNLARGGVVDERALHKTLTDDGILRGAALDVHENEGEGKISLLADLPNVILTPHIGAQAVDSQREIGERIIETVDSYGPARKKT